MRHTYCALMHPASEGGYIVDFPDLENCFTEGDSIEEAKDMAEDVLATHVNYLLDNNKAIPAATMDSASLLAKANPDFGPVAFVMPVTVYTAKAPKAVHLNITIQEDKLEILTDFINSCGMKRSTFLVTAAMEKMARMKADK